MAIFKCYYCDDIFDLSMKHDLDGLPFCGKCYSIYRDKLKPKIFIREYDDFDAKHHIPEPTKVKKTKGKNK